jgi:oxygen-independent coproporphyrinogen-3 oxidase
MHPDHALLVKYSKPGPRYTSYPPAPHFAEDFGIGQWRQEIIESQDASRPISLYVHIPFCDTLCFYCGCNMVATQKYEKAQEYLKYLKREIDEVAALTSSSRRVVQLHWGGGTPTFLKAGEIRDLAAHIRSRFNFDPRAEVSVEVDPRGLLREQVDALRESGFNRASIGVQDLNEQVQKAVNRVQPLSLIQEVYGWFREANFQSINMDLMVGLPHQTLETYKDTLREITAMAPDRLAVFGYAHVPWMKKHQKLIVQSDLPNFETRMALQEQILETLESKGYVHVGMDHFAKPDDEIVKAQRSKTLWRNFQGYTTHRNADIYGFGASSISQTNDVYAQNEKRPTGYQQMIGEHGLATVKGYRMTTDDKLRRDVIIELMCDLVVNKQGIGTRWNIDFNDYFAKSLELLNPLVADGLVEADANEIRVTTLGRLFLRNIAMCFDAYLNAEKPKAPGQETPRYSMTA